MEKFVKKRIWIVVVSVIILIIAGGVISTSIILGKINNKTLPESDEELGIITTPEQSEQTEQEEEKDNKIINIAFFGLDRRIPDAASRSDTIMVVSIDKKNQKVKVASLMRDMYVPIPGKRDNRINAAYAIGDAPLAIKTINSNFGLDIRDYVTIDFFGMEALIDKLGGIEIDVKDYEIARTGVQKPGLQKLNGKQALAYSRIRKVGNADYERTERQRRVVNELFKKIKSQGIMKIPGLVLTLLPYVETSLSRSEIIELALQAAKFDTENIDQYRLPVDGTFKSQKIDGMSVLVPDIEVNKQKLHEFIYGETVEAAVQKAN